MMKCYLYEDMDYKKRTIEFSRETILGPTETILGPKKAKVAPNAAVASEAGMKAAVASEAEMRVEIMNKHYEQIEERLETSAERLQTLKANTIHLMQLIAIIKSQTAGKAGNKR